MSEQQSTGKTAITAARDVTITIIMMLGLLVWGIFAAAGAVLNAIFGIFR